MNIRAAVCVLCTQDSFFPRELKYKLRVIKLRVSLFMLIHIVSTVIKALWPVRPCIF